MKAYINHMDSLVRREQDRRMQKIQTRDDPRLTPLVERLKRFIEALPPEERNTPRSLEFYRSALRGRKGRAAHAGEVGESLRALGYLRRRAWVETEGGFRAVWVPQNYILKGY